jgi:hypothetical protein
MPISKQHKSENVMEKKFEFCSKEWVSLLAQLLRDGLVGENLAGIDFTFCEEFVRPPQHLLRQGSQSIGFFYRIREGELEVGDGPLADDETTVKIIADYKTALPLAQRTHAENNMVTGKDRDQRTRERIASGELRMKGNFSQLIPVVEKLGLHDIIAQRTL